MYVADSMEKQCYTCIIIGAGTVQKESRAFKSASTMSRAQFKYFVEIFSYNLFFF